MEVKSCFNECCMACNSLCPNYRTSKIQGQGDYKGNIDFQEHQFSWEKGRNLGKKFGEENRFGFKEEQEEKQLSTYCNCLAKNNQTEDYKITHEAKYEKQNIEFFQKCTTPRNSSYANWSNNEIKQSTVFEDLKNKHSNCEKLFAETISELKEKVEFLLKNFKNYNPKLLNIYNNEISHGDNDNDKIIPKDIHYLFNINKRLNIAEKNIQKLTLILEDLLTDSDKKKALLGNKVPIFSEQLKFEEMSIAQRINLLKSRNDYLFDFMKDFLQVRSIEELYSTVDSVQNDYELNKNPRNSTYCFVDGNELYNLNRENVMETLKDLRSKVSKKEKTKPSYNEVDPIKHGKRSESATKCFRNKLEVISEQAELAFYYDTEYKNSNESKKNSDECLKEKVSDAQENKNAYDKTAKLFAMEAMLKSSLDNPDFENLSNPDSFESKKNSPNLSIESSTERDTENSLESSRVYWESKNTKKPELKDVKKYPDLRENKKKITEKNNEPGSSSLSKTTSITTNSTNNPSDSKNPSLKLFARKIYKPLTPPERPKSRACYLPELCSFSREENKKEIKSKIQRPMSTPGFLSSTSTSRTIGSIPEKNRKKISGINNVKNKNKTLLSQKSCVQTT